MSDGKVVSLRQGFVVATGQPEPNPEVVAYLEELCERAKSGVLVACAVVYQDHEGCVNDWNVGGVSMSMIGAMEYRKTYMIRQVVASDEARADRQPPPPPAS